MKITLLKSSFIAMLFTWLALSAAPTYADNPVTIYKGLDQLQTTDQLPIVFDIILNSDPGANVTLLAKDVVISGTAKVDGEAVIVTGNSRWWKLIITKVISPGIIMPIIPANVIGDNRLAIASISNRITYKVSSATKLTKKYHPGHYVLVNPNDTLEIATRSLNIMGVQKRYYWRTLEPALDQYDFSSIRADLEYARQHNLQLILFITDKTLQGDTVSALPEYIINEYNGEFRYTDPVNNDDVRIAKRWKANVQGRYLALLRSLGSAFDANPNLEGINLQETNAQGVLTDLAAEYNAETYHAHLIERLNETAKAFPTTRVHLMINGFPISTPISNDDDLYRNIVFVRTMATAVMRIDGVYSGPGILPFSTGLNHKFGVYPVYNELADLMVTGCSANLESFNHKYPSDYPNTVGLKYPFTYSAGKADSFVELQQIFDFGLDTLKLEYFIWREVDPTKDPTIPITITYKFDPHALTVINDPANVARFYGGTVVSDTVYLPLVTK